MVKLHHPPDVRGLDVSEDMGDPHIRAKADEFNARYLHWDEVRYRVDDDLAERVWAVMRHIRCGSAVRVDLCGPGHDFHLVPAFIDVPCHIGGTSEGEGSCADANTHPPGACDPVMEEAVASSRMEGATVTYADAISMLTSGRGPRDTGERMVWNNHSVMTGLMGYVDRDLTPDIIREMHATLVSGTLRYGPEWEGRFRESDDIIVGDPLDADVMHHTPPHHRDVPRLIDGLCRFANASDPTRIHPVIGAILIHYAVGYIHPFVDGNGRLARSLHYWYLMRHGCRALADVPISPGIMASKGRYGLAYRHTETDGNDLTYFIRYNLDRIRMTMGLRAVCLPKD